MRVLALLPDIHRAPTGGNLFNRQVLSFLDGVATVERMVVAEGAPIAVATPIAGRQPDVALVDSLLLDAAAPALRDSNCPGLLLAHYLRLLEPGLRDSPGAQRERRSLERIDGVVTTSRYSRDVLLREGFARGRLAVVAPGLARGYTADVVARPSGTPRLLTVSSLLPGKGLRQLLAVLDTLVDLDWTWEVAGEPGLDPGFASDFLARLARSSLADRVRVLGTVDPDRMVALYDRCHLFVLPSRFESCSMATMEAMARGLPVVAFRCGGLAERVPAETAGLLAEPGDAARLGTNLRRLLGDPERAAAMGRANRRASRSFHDWEASGASLWEFVRRRVRVGAA